jgi:hypothetical protein
MQAQLWTISGLAVELAQDRRSLARRLEGLEPDEESEDKAGRVSRKWRMARVVAHMAGVSTDLDANKERARKDKESADKLALENARTRGELAAVTEIADWYGAHIDRCSTRLDQIPDALGQLCDPRIAAIVIPECRRLIHEARAELAIDVRHIGGDDSDEVDTAPDRDRESMGRRKPQTLE